MPEAKVDLAQKIEEKNFDNYTIAGKGVKETLK